MPFSDANINNNLEKIITAFCRVYATAKKAPLYQEWSVEGANPTSQPHPRGIHQNTVWSGSSCESRPEPGVTISDFSSKVLPNADCQETWQSAAVISLPRTSAAATAGSSVLHHRELPLDGNASRIPAPVHRPPQASAACAGIAGLRLPRQPFILCN